MAGPLGDEIRRRVAHDVRASLNTIAGWTEIARQETTDDAMRGRAVDTILRHVRQASRRLDDAMDLWRIELGTLPVHPAPVHVPADGPGRDGERRCRRAAVAARPGD